MAYSAFGINYDTAAKITAYGGDAETPAQPIWAEDTNQLWIVHGTQGKYRVAMASELSSYLTTANASSTYLSKTDAAKTYLDINAKAKSASVADNATHATSADSATKAAQDAAGNDIVDTYSTKAQLTEGLATKLGKTEKAASASTADSVAWTGVTGRPDPIPKSGSTGSITTYETTVTATTVSDTSARSMTLANGGTVTVNNGSSGKAWITVVALAGSATVTLGSSWSWSGSAPTLAKGLVTLAWQGTFGVATFTKFGSE